MVRTSFSATFEGLDVRKWTWEPGVGLRESQLGIVEAVEGRLECEGGDGETGDWEGIISG